MSAWQRWRSHGATVATAFGVLAAMSFDLAASAWLYPLAWQIRAPGFFLDPTPLVVDYNAVPRADALIAASLLAVFASFGLYRVAELRFPRLLLSASLAVAIHGLVIVQYYAWTIGGRGVYPRWVVIIYCGLLLVAVLASRAAFLVVTRGARSRGGVTTPQAIDATREQPLTGFPLPAAGIVTFTNHDVDESEWQAFRRLSDATHGHELMLINVMSLLREANHASTARAELRRMANSLQRTISANQAMLCRCASRLQRQLAVLDEACRQLEVTLEVAHLSEGLAVGRLDGAASPDLDARLGDMRRMRRRWRESLEAFEQDVLGVASATPSRIVMQRVQSARLMVRDFAIQRLHVPTRLAWSLSADMSVLLLALAAVSLLVCPPLLVLRLTPVAELVADAAFLFFAAGVGGVVLELTMATRDRG